MISKYTKRVAINAYKYRRQRYQIITKVKWVGWGTYNPLSRSWLTPLDTAYITRRALSLRTNFYNPR